MKRKGLLFLGAILATPYLLKPLYRKRGTTTNEAKGLLPGDDIVTNPKVQYTQAITIQASPVEIWPWLVQIGRGRAGFYTLEWIEHLLQADIHNVDKLLPRFQTLNVGDKIWLTPNPNFGKLPGQYLVVNQIEAPHTLIFHQRLPNGSTATWAFILRPNNGITRLLFRRRSERLSLFDKIAEPGYFIMDWYTVREIRK